MKVTRLAQYAWGVLLYNVLVILWGAYVRASGSGAGCGAHWPLCNGQIVPTTPHIATIIEFSHRLTSGLSLLLVLGLVIWARHGFPKGHRVRAAAYTSLFFIGTEALVGAGLVLFEYVAFNVTIARAYWVATHLANTFLLLAALTATAWWASGGPGVALRRQGSLTWLLGGALLGVLVLGSSGAVTALGDTLVLAAGIAPEQSPVVAQLVALRLYHPLIAFLVGGIVFWAAATVALRRGDPTTKRLAVSLSALYGMQLLLGALNVALKAPIWIQIGHLLLSDTIWIALVLLAMAGLADNVLPSRAVANAPTPGPAEGLGIS